MQSSQVQMGRACYRVGKHRLPGSPELSRILIRLRQRRGGASGLRSICSGTRLARLTKLWEVPCWHINARALI